MEDILVFRKLNPSKFNKCDFIEEKNKRMSPRWDFEQCPYIDHSDDVEIGYKFLGVEITGGYQSYSNKIDENYYYSVIPAHTPIFLCYNNVVMSERIISFKTEDAFNTYKKTHLIADTKKFEEVIENVVDKLAQQ